MSHIEHDVETRTPRPGHPPVGWRRDRLAAAGFPRGLAARLARDTRYDLHALVNLAERGCAPELAARILRPVDGAGVVT